MQWLRDAADESPCSNTAKNYQGSAGGEKGFHHLVVQLALPRKKKSNKNYCGKTSHQEPYSDTNPDTDICVA